MTDTRHCNGCCRELPLDPFPRYRRGQPQRHSRCNGCRNRADAARRASQRRRDISKQLTQILNEHEVDKATQLVEAMVRHYGGFDAFVLKWKQAIDEAPPNSLFALRSMNSVIHLAMLVGPQRERAQATWLKTASDEELLREAERLGAKIGKPR